MFEIILKDNRGAIYKSKGNSLVKVLWNMQDFIINKYQIYKR